MSAFDYKLSTITKYRSGTSTDPYIDITETKKVINGQIQLNEIPVLLNKVKVNGMFEVPTSNRSDLEDNQYRADYVEGMLYFHPTAEGMTLTYSYRGRGGHFLSVDRIWTKESDGQVIETLGDILSTGSDAIENIQHLVELIGQTETVRDQTIVATNEADQASLEAYTQAEYSKAVGDSLTHTGDYSASVGYVVRNIVYYLGSTYMCISNTNGVLPTDETKWKKITNMIWKGVYSPSTTYNFGDVVGDSVKENVYMCISDETLNITLTTVANWTPMLSVADAILNVNTKATHAQTQGDYAKTQGDYAKNLINKGTYDNATTYKALNIVVYSSGVWQCLQDSIGIEPTPANYLNWQLLMQSAASVTWDSVAGRPDVEGHIANQNIHVTAAKQTSWDAKETTTGSQTKATQALTDAKLYTDSLAGVGNTKTVKKLSDEIGILSNLTTADKSSLVGAVNENSERMADIAINVKDFGASSSAQTTTGSITSGSNELTVSNIVDFKQGQGVFVEGNKEVSSLTISSVASASGNITITLDGTAFIVAVTTGDTAVQVATKIRASAFARWTAGGTAGTTTVTFTATRSGAKVDGLYNGGATGVTGTITTTTQGTDGLIASVVGIFGTKITLSTNATVTVNNVVVMHDSTIAFETAIAACGSKEVLLIPPPDAYYRIGRTLVLTKPICIQGASYFSGVAINDPTIVFASTVKTGFEITAIGDVTIERLLLRMDSITSDTVAGININTTGHVSVANMQIRDVFIHLGHTFGAGVKGKGVITSKLLNVRTFQGSYGFYFDSNGTSISFDTCWAMSCTVTGYYLASHEYCSFINCACDSPNNPNYAYHINSCNGVTFTSCGAEGMGKTMFLFQAGVGIAVIGCRSVGMNQLGTAVATFAELINDARDVTFVSCMDPTTTTANVSVTGGRYPVAVNCLFPRISLNGVTNVESFTDRGSLKIGGWNFYDSPFSGAISIASGREMAILAQRMGVLKQDVSGYLGYIDADGAIVPVNMVLPAPSSSYRGKIVRVEGAAGVIDKLYICRKTAADAYEWKHLDL